MIRCRNSEKIAANVERIPYKRFARDFAWKSNEIVGCKEPREHIEIYHATLFDFCIFGKNIGKLYITSPYSLLCQK